MKREDLYKALKAGEIDSGDLKWVLSDALNEKARVRADAFATRLLYMIEEGRKIGKTDEEIKEQLKAEVYTFGLQERMEARNELGISW